MSDENVQRVAVTDIRMNFRSIVVFMVKWAFTTDSGSTPHLTHCDATLLEILHAGGRYAHAGDDDVAWLAFQRS